MKKAVPEQPMQESATVLSKAWLSVLVAWLAACAHSPATLGAEDKSWSALASSYIEAEQRQDRDSRAAREDAERSLVRSPLPDRRTVLELIDSGSEQERHEAIVAAMVQGSADARIAQAILRKWLQLNFQQKMHALRAIDRPLLNTDEGVQAEEVRVLRDEADIRIKVAILYTVASEATPTVMPLLVAYCEDGTDAVAGVAYTVASRSGAQAVSQLKHELIKRGAVRAIRLIERLERGETAPFPESPGPE